MQRYRLGLCALGFAGALLASTAALAGYRHTLEVGIDDVGRVAWGDLGYVFNTSDRTQYMGCYNSGTSGTCYARDRTGLTRTCSTSNAGMLAVIRSLSGDSYLLFYWDASGNCTSVDVHNGSNTAPKT